MSRLYVYILIFIAVYFILKYGLKFLVNRKMNKVNTGNKKKKFDPDQIEDADYEEIKKD